MKIYQPTLGDRVLELFAMLLYGTWKILIWTVVIALVIAIPVGLYLGVVAVPWLLYNYVAEYALPAHWEPALRQPDYWHFLAFFSLLGGLRLLWVLPNLPIRFSRTGSNGESLRFSLGKKSQ